MASLNGMVLVYGKHHVAEVGVEPARAAAASYIGHFNALSEFLVSSRACVGSINVVRKRDPEGVASVSSHGERGIGVASRRV